MLDSVERAGLDPGRHAARPLGLRLEHYDPVRVGALELDRYADPTIVVPDTLTRSSGAVAYLARYGMLDNDTYGDCVPAAGYHMQEALRLKFNLAPYPWSAGTCLAAYFACNRVPPGAPGSSSDQGTDPSVWMNYWQHTGLPGHKLAGWGYVPASSPNVRRCIAEFGAVLLAIELSTQQQNQGTDWVYVNGQECGSWGGHGVCVDSYDPAGFGLITWGEFGSANNPFAVNCGDGFWVPLTGAQIGPGGVGPFGFSFDRMKSDLAALTQGEK